MTAPVPRSAESIQKELLDQEFSLALTIFDADTAWDLGCTLRALAVEQHPGKAVYISIIHAGTDKPIFFARTKGITPGQITKLEGIWNAVKCLEMSTWRADHRYGGNKESVGPNCSLTPGGWPIRVKGVEGILAVLIVHGLGLKLDSNGNAERTPVIGTYPVYTASLDHELILDALKIVLNRQQNTTTVLSDEPI
jgi:uncharacterized protein (UPF0303 family)